MTTGYWTHDFKGRPILVTDEVGLPRREFPLIQNDPANPASGRFSSAFTSDAAKSTPLGKDEKTTNKVYLSGFADGRKSVDRWAPAFAGLIVGACLTVLIVFSMTSVLS